MKVKKVKNRILWIVIALLATSAVASGGILLVKSIKNAALSGNKANVAWYNENDDEFIISTSEELYEIAKLSQYYDFKDQTVKLDADIVLNEGNASDWEEKVPENMWYPITGFAGTFDGQGHTISGVYGKSLHASMGLFTDTQKECVIKDIRLVNSYFYSVSHQGTGSIIGAGAGKLDSIYSDAKIVNHGFYTGGIIGNVNQGGEIRVTNTWFDGEIELQSYVGRFAGGIVGNVKLVGGIVSIEHCLNTGTITCDSPMSPNVGGIVGAMQAGGTVNITDTLNVGTITTNGGIYGIGSVIGRVVDNKPKLQIKSTYATTESYKQSNGGSAARITGNVICMSEEALSGFSSYKWTELDFDKYWTVVVDKTPVLKYFAKDQVSIEGIAKGFNTAWYDEEATTYIISSREDLYGMQMLAMTTDFAGKTFKLRNDIVINEGDAKAWVKTAPEYIWTPIGNMTTGNVKQFQGTFDGQGHTISGMYATGTSCVGLFGIIGEKGLVKNLKLANSYIINESEKADSWGITGSIVGQLRGKLDTIYVDKTVTVTSQSKYTGGVVGMARKNTTISNCWSAAHAKGIAITGGIVGSVFEGTHLFEHCLYSGEIEYEANIGGICGIVESNADVTITDSLNVGKIGVNKGETKKYGQGAILARVISGKVTLKDVYATSESCSKAIDYPNDKVSGKAILISEDTMKGNDGYHYTYLDFNKFWSVVAKGTPILKSFAEKSPSVAKLKKKVDFSWYKDGKKEYTIKTKEQLLGFAMMSASDTFEGKTIKLGADIKLNDGNASDWANTAPENVWTPVGNITSGNVSMFRGTFDGQGHIISGMYAKGTSCVGLFGIVGVKGLVKNLKLANSYIVNENKEADSWGITGSVVGQLRGKLDTIYVDSTVTVTSQSLYTGGVAGMTRDNTTISNCWSAAYVKGIAITGGIVGTAFGGKHIIEHCLNSGAIDYAANIGGMCGAVDSKADVTIKDSFNVGQVGAKKGSVTKYGQGAILARVISGKVTLEDVYATSESCKKAIDYPNDKVAGKAILISEDTLKGNDGYHYTYLDFDKFWSVVVNETPVLKSFIEQSPSVAGLKKKVDFSWYDDSKKEYTIKTKEQLFGFAMISASDTFEGKTIKLGADIKLNEGDIWTPVGNITSGNVSMFQGTFNAQGHTISGINVRGTSCVGLFGIVGEKGIVKNLKLAKSNIVNENKDADSWGITGSVVGQLRGKLDTIYVDSTVTVTSQSLYTGGIAGMSRDNTSISNCWSAAHVKATAIAGGIVGTAFEGKHIIEHCLNSGVIDYAANIAGICGTVDGKADVTIKDSLNVGQVGANKGSVTKYGQGAIIARVLSGNVAVENVYATTESCNNAINYPNNKVTGTVETLIQSSLLGYGSYDFTELDFDTYWVAISGKTAELKSFSVSDSLKVLGRTKPDITWYKSEDSEFTLTTPSQLIGLSVLAKTEDFAGKTIKLGEDIDVNPDWTAGEEEPEYVWNPIGTSNKPFAGTFNGQGHTISGLYVKSSADYISLFGDVRNGAVTNFSVRNSYFESSGSLVSGAVAYTQNSTISDIYSNAIVVTTNTSEFARGAGILSQGDTGTVTVSNCWFDGTVTSGGGFNGGIVGRASAVTMNLSHCLNTGTVSSTFGGTNKYTGGIIGGINNANTSIISVSDTLSAGTLKLTGSTACSGTAFGFIGYNARVTMSNVYASTNKAFIDGVESTHVINVGSPDTGSISDMTGVDLSGFAGYANTKLDFANFWAVDLDGTPILKTFADDIPDLPTINTADTNWYKESETEFILTTANQLLGISVLSNDGVTFEGKTIKLGASIVLNEGDAKDWDKKAPMNNWTPIGNSETPFKGSFNGQGHTISGLYVKSAADYISLFGDVRNGTITNFRVKNSYFESSGSHVSGAVAYTQNSTISDIYSNAIVITTNTGEFARGAGILSQGDTGTVTVSNCWFDGTVTSGGGFNGGIVGRASAVTMNLSHCLNTGTVSSTFAGTNKFTGGIIGGINNGNTTIVSVSDTLSAGTLKLTGSTACSGTAFGFIGYNARVTMSNVYATTNKAFIGGVETTHVINVGSPDTGSITDLTGKSILGEDARTNASGLDYENYWITAPGKIPELKNLQKITTNTLLLNQILKTF